MFPTPFLVLWHLVNVLFLLLVFVFQDVNKGKRQYGMMYLVPPNYICILFFYFKLLNDGVARCSVNLLVLDQQVSKNHIYFFSVIYPDSLTSCYEQMLNGICLLNSYTIFLLLMSPPCNYISSIYRWLTFRVLYDFVSDVQHQDDWDNIFNDV